MLFFSFYFHIVDKTNHLQVLVLNHNNLRKRDLSNKIISQKKKKNLRLWTGILQPIEIKSWDTCFLFCVIVHSSYLYHHRKWWDFYSESCRLHKRYRHLATLDLILFFSTCNLKGIFYLIFWRHVVIIFHFVYKD